MPIQRLDTSDAGIACAASLIAGGGLVAFPTETVYGLGADATRAMAVARIFEAKGRPSFNPLIVHLPDLDAARAIAAFSDDALALAGAFWPGPMTLVLRLRQNAGIASLVTAGLDTVALRVPASPLACALLRRAGRPVAAPSANPSGRISATTAEAVIEGLGDRIDAVLDGGGCEIGIESTILDASGSDVRLLRPGGLPLEAVRACIGRDVAAAPQPEAPDAPVSPGRLASHYAPDAALRLDVTRPEAGEALLGFGPVEAAALNLSPSGDLREAAANLFSHLRALDRRADRIAVSPIPDHGLGLAINDRLLRAAAPRT